VLAAGDYGVAWCVVALPVLVVVLWSQTGASRYARNGGLQPVER